MNLHFAIMTAEGFGSTGFLSMFFKAMAANRFMASSTIKQCVTHDTCIKKYVPAFILWFSYGGLDMYKRSVFAHMFDVVTYWGAFFVGQAFAYAFTPPFTENI